MFDDNVMLEVYLGNKAIDRIQKCRPQAQPSYVKTIQVI